MNKLIFAVPLVFSLVACGRPTATNVPELPVVSGTLALEGVSKVTPEGALKRATAKAYAWNSDARLVAVAWGVPKSELASVVFHLFYSPGSGKLFRVQTKLVNFWQNTLEITDAKYCKPARLLDTVGTYPIDARRALEIATSYLPVADPHPLALMIELKPARLSPPVWLGSANRVKLIIDAQSGKVLMHAQTDLPPLPFTDE